MAAYYLVLAIICFAGLLQLTIAACPACPPGGVWSAWSSGTSCTETCGLCGEFVQKRTCKSYQWGCPCTGPYSRKRVCPVKPCSAPNATCCGSYTVTNNKCGPIPAEPAPSTVTCSEPADACWCPPKGVWSAWKTQGSCSKTCGLCGTVPQNRTCLSADWGCPCTGAASRNLACTNKPCPAPTPCCGTRKVVTNTQTGTKVCGLQLPDDPVYANKCKCNVCTKPMMTIAEGGLLSPFTSTVFQGTGCHTYRAVCTSLTGRQVWIELNNGTSGVISDTTKLDVTFQCASDGSGWQLTRSGTTAKVSMIGCLAVTCANEPDLPEC